MVGEKMACLKCGKHFQIPATTQAGRADKPSFDELPEVKRREKANFQAKRDLRLAVVRARALSESAQQLRKEVWKATSRYFDIWGRNQQEDRAKFVATLRPEVLQGIVDQLEESTGTHSKKLRELALRQLESGAPTEQNAYLNPVLESPTPAVGDSVPDAECVPVRLEEFSGQRNIKDALGVLLTASKRQKRPLPHLLFCGPPDMGKGTLAVVLANELGTTVQMTQGELLKGPADLMPYLTNAAEGSIVFIEEINRLGQSAEEFLYSAVETFRVDIVHGAGKNARTVTVPLKPFTLIGTTSKPSQSARYRRLMIAYEFASYAAEEIAEIVIILGKAHALVIELDSAMTLAAHLDGTPGDALTLVKRLADYFAGDADGRISPEITQRALQTFGYQQRPFTPIELAERLRRMSGTDLEDFVADVFRRLGYSVEKTPASGDHGIDLLLHIGGASGVVQCKRWNDPVGEPVVRDFYGAMMAANAESGYLVTTSSFTPAASAFAEGKPVKLIDLDALIHMAREVNSNNTTP
jgi:Holliday junction DNA helicase RuvB